MADTLTDVYVTLEVEQQSTPLNLGMLAIFTPGTALGMKTYESAGDVLANETDKNVQAVASGYFAQTDHATKLLIITYVDDITAALDQYGSAGWEFGAVAGANVNDTVKSAFSNYIEGQGKQFFVLNLPATEETVNNAATISKQYFGNTRTIAFAAGTDEASSLNGAGALVGALGNKVVGSITWKFKALTGVDVANLTAAQVKKLHENNIFTYVIKGDNKETSEGFTIGGRFIDDLHGDDWIKGSLEKELQNLLHSTAKLSYDTKGIAQIDATITGVLMQATTNGIILIDPDSGNGAYTVTTKSRSEADATDISGRHYKGASFTYVRSGAIHDITVHGTVSL